MPSFFSDEYRTYRLLLPETSAGRGDFQRKLARFLKPHHSAIQFAEQFNALEVFEARKALHYQSEKQKVREVTAVTFNYNPKSVGGVGPSSFSVNVQSHRFQSISVQTDRGIRTIISADVLKRHDDECNPMVVGYTSRIDDAQTGLNNYLPWRGWLQNRFSSDKTLNMMFGNINDAHDYAARITKMARMLNDFSLDGALQYEED